MFDQLITTIDCLPCAPADARALFSPAAAPADPIMARALGDPLLIDTWPAERSSSGEWVDERIALTFLAVYACVRVLSETLATLPLDVCRVLPDGSEIPDPDDPLHAMLRHRPNKETSSFVWKETKQSHLCTWGNCYSEIQRNRGGAVIGLWQRTPDRFRPRRRPDTHELYYEYLQPWGGLVELDPLEVVHIPGLGFDGLMGYSPIRVMAQSVGLGLGAQRFAAEFFKNDARPGGVLEYPGIMTDQTFSRFKERWQQTGAAAGTRHRLRILEEGMKWVATQVSPEDAQLIATRRFQTEDVCRAYRVPPHFVQDLEHATFSNIEELGMQFLIYTILPWVERWEDELNYKILRNDPRRVIRFNLFRFLRADVSKRTAFYTAGRQWGWYSSNDIRRAENLPPIAGGDVYLSPLNMVPVDRLGAIYDKPENKKETPPAAEEKPARARAAELVERAYGPLFADAARRLLKREQHAYDGAAEKRSGQDLVTWAEQFYAAHRAWSAEAWLPVVEAAGRALLLPSACGRGAGGEGGDTVSPDAKRWSDLAGRIAANVAAGSIDEIRRGRAPDFGEARAAAMAAAAIGLVVESAIEAG